MLAEGEPVTGPGRHRLVMFQESGLFPWLDVMGNVLFGLKLKPGLSNNDRREVAKFYLKLVGLEKFMHANIHEPFAALDALTREQLYGDIQRIWSSRQKTILFVTHNVREAVCLGDRVVLFSAHPGRIREEFAVDLPRPRDINSLELAGLSAEITRALKGYSKPGGEVSERTGFLTCAASCAPATERDGPGDRHHAGDRGHRFAGGQGALRPLGAFPAPTVGNGADVRRRGALALDPLNTIRQGCRPGGFPCLGRSNGSPASAPAVRSK